MVYIPIENKIDITKRELEKLLTDFSHMIGEVGEENEQIMQSILDKSYEAFTLLENLEEKLH